jgi:hypothetical protein
VNFRSGITLSSQRVRARKPRPEITIGTANPARLSRPAARVPSSVALRWTCCSRANAAATRCCPTSSVIQAWVAPEVKVEPIPHTT